MEISNRKLDGGVWSSAGKVKSRIMHLKVMTCPESKPWDQIKLIKEKMRKREG